MGKKVLILYNSLFHYRIPIFNLLAETVDLTVAYSMGSAPLENMTFKVIKLPILKFGRIVLHRNNVRKLCDDFDVVIAYGDIAWLSLSTLPFHERRRFKVIFWSIGVSASYEKKFDTVTKFDGVRNFFFKRADALIFYSDYPIKKYTSIYGLDSKKMFVACNTVSISNVSEGGAKNSLLFIGTLYMQKGLLELLENYRLAYKATPDILPLNIIGGGAEYEKVAQWIKENELSSKIFLRGAIYDKQEKAALFSRAVACISPLQAGLSVLESMGHGVPFITMHDAITGGERFNIKHGINGVLLQELSELHGVIKDASMNTGKYLQMGEEARRYYEANRRPEDMVRGLIDAIEYVSPT